MATEQGSARLELQTQDVDSIASARQKLALRPESCDDELVARAGGGDEHETLLGIEVVLASGFVGVARELLGHRARFDSGDEYAREFETFDAVHGG